MYRMTENMVTQKILFLNWNTSNVRISLSISNGAKLFEFYSLLGLFIISLILLLHYIKQKHSYWQKRNIPFIKPNVIFGNFTEVFMLNSNIGLTLEKLYKEGKDKIVGIYLFQRPTVLIRDPELLKLVLVKDFKYFNDRAITQNLSADPIGSNMLFLMKNPKWKDMRRKVAPAFASGKMRHMYEYIQESSYEVSKYLGNVIQDSKVLELRKIFGSYSTYYLTAIGFGIRSSCFVNPNCIFRKITERILNFDTSFSHAIQSSCYFVAPYLVKIFRMRFLEKFATENLNKIFCETIKQRENDGSHDDVLSTLQKINRGYKEANELDKDAVVAQAVQFFAAGYETSMSTITFTLYELAKNPKIQKRLREEILEISNRHNGIHYDSLQEMQYLINCVDEALRKYPILPFLDRVCTQDYKIPGTDIIIEKGTLLYVSVKGLHYDEKYFPEPEKFDPERFDKARNELKDFIYMPFGEGPRNCLGKRFGLLSVRSGVAHLLSEYEVELDEYCDNKIIFNPKGFLLAPISGLRLKLRRL